MPNLAQAFVSPYHATAASVAFGRMYSASFLASLAAVAVAASSCQFPLTQLLLESLPFWAELTPTPLRAGDEELAALASACMLELLPFLDGYIWQKERFTLSPSTQVPPPWARKAPTGTQSIPKTSRCHIIKVFF